MKKVFFSGGDDNYADVLPLLKQRFEKLNGFELRIMSQEQYVDFMKAIPNSNVSYPMWRKVFLWDMAPDADMVGWVDADMIPVMPLGEFAAGISMAKDTEITDLHTYFKYIYHSDFTRGYFNAGFVVATREAIPVFEAWKKYIGSPQDDIHKPLLEQSLLNLVLQDTAVKLNVLPREYNYLCKEGSAPAGTVMAHYAGIMGPVPKQNLRVAWQQLVGPLPLHCPLPSIWPETYVVSHDVKDALIAVNDVIRTDMYNLGWLRHHPVVLVDIGAHVGVFSKYARFLFPKARIIAVEPHPENYKRLVENLKDCNVETINAALGDGEELRCCYMPQGSVETQFSSKGAGDPVTSVRLQELFEMYEIEPQGTMLKIDCEGGEEVLMRDVSARDILTRVMYLAMELHVSPEARFAHLPSAAQWSNFFGGLGCRKTSFTNDKVIPRVYAENAHGLF